MYLVYIAENRRIPSDHTNKVTVELFCSCQELDDVVGRYFWLVYTSNEFFQHCLEINHLQKLAGRWQIIKQGPVELWWRWTMQVVSCGQCSGAIDVRNKGLWRWWLL